MYVLPLILGVAIFAVFLFGTVGIGLTAVKFKSMGNNSNNKVLSKEFRNQLIQAYNKAFSAMNLKAMTDMLTDYMYYTTQCTLEVLKKLSIRKEVEFTPDPEVEAAAGQSQFEIVQSDGKNDFTLSTMKGEYKESYYDIQTNKLLFQRKKKTSYNIGFLKCNEELKDRPYCCMNCGDELIRNGNMFDCPSCQTHYQAENYEWNISDIQVSGDDGNPWVKPVLWAGLGILIVSALEALIQSVGLLVILLLIDVAAGALTYMYLKYVYIGINTLKELQKRDPKSSRMALLKRVNFLIRTLEQAKDYRLQDVAAFMPESLYNELNRVNEYDDYHLIDFEITKMYTHDYRVENGNQYVDLDISMNRIMMNPNQKIKEKKVKACYTIYKSVDAMTKTDTSAQAITCPGCGANINVVRDGKCTYCGAGIDISKFDWVFAKVPM